MTEPNSKDLIDPLFNAIWNVIKHWDIGKDYPPDTEGEIRHKGGRLYSGATGTDVMTIIEAINSVKR